MRPPSSAIPAIALFALLSVPVTAAVFEVNHGQTDPRYRFIAREPRGAVLVQRDGWTVTGKGIRTSFRLVGANEERLEAVEPLASRSNYFIGNEPAGWVRDIPHYSEVALRGAYDGIDVVLHHRDGAFEYDFVVAAGADPRRIAIDVDVDAAPALQRDGSILFANGLRQQKPVAYQELGGTRREIPVAYAIEGNRIAFDLGSYDPTQPLTIDPVISWSTFFGGSNDDVAHAMAMDAEGNTYIGGATFSLDMPVLSAFQLTNKSSPTTEDAFVTKFDPHGAIVYSTYIGSAQGYDRVLAIAVDQFGNAYAGGETHTTNFPTTPGAYQTFGNPRVGSDGFITKFGPRGNQLEFSTYLASTSTVFDSSERVRDITLAPNGDIWFALTTSHPSFPITPGAFQSSGCGSVASPVVGKIDRIGTQLLASTYICGGLSDAAAGVALDSAGNVYLAGDFSSTRFPAIGDSITTAGFRDVFLVKFDPTLSRILELAGMGGFFSEWVADLVIDAKDNIWVAGKTSSTDFPLVAPTQATFGGRRNCLDLASSSFVCGDAFLMKVDSSLNVLFSTFVGGIDDDEITGLALGAGGRVYVGGTTRTADFPVLNPPWALPFGGGRSDAFVASYLSSGKLEWSMTIGGNAIDQGHAIAAAGDALVLTGLTDSPNFPLFNASKSTLGRADEDAFVLRLTVPAEVGKRRSSRH